jgi:hypothetical protein
MLIQPEEGTEQGNGKPFIQFIDFEYCAYNYRAFDIANHFCGNNMICFFVYLFLIIFVSNICSLSISFSLKRISWI